MLDELLINPSAMRQIGLFLKKAANLMLAGPAGSGKRTIAEAIARSILISGSSDSLASYPYFLHITKEPDKQEISIDSVRQIIEFFHLKTPGKGAIRRIVLIENAQTMSLEAQNALLKILEEPNDDSIFILTADSARNVLPTIASRCQLIEVRAPNLVASLDYFERRYSAIQIESAWKLSQGTAGLMSALLDKDKSHPLKTAVNDAKQLLKLNRFGRQLQLEKVLKNKAELSLFLEALNRVITSLHQSAVKSGKVNQASGLLADRKLIKKLQKAAEANVSPRLIGLNLVLKLSI